MVKAATLAVGTEITDGQISDRNSQWLSARAVLLGYEMVEHRAVADDRQRILSGLRELSRDVKLVFVTGGLGPTSDDFTRESVAEFLEQPLEWDDASWESILERLKARGTNVTENQKQQCYFPKGAVILKNANGTANAFMAKTASGVTIVSLPGPPREIEAIWEDGLAERLRLPSTQARRELTLLRTMGLGEGALANGVEKIIDDVLAQNDGVARPGTGYRAHAPYVEVKLWADESQTSVVRDVAREIRRQYRDILINEGSEDVADAVLARIATESAAGIKTIIFDGITQGQLLARLYERASEMKDSAALAALSNTCSCVVDSHFSKSQDLLKPESNTSVLAVTAGTHDLEVLVSRGAREKHIQLAKLAVSVRSERGRKWAVETALREWGHS